MGKVYDVRMYPFSSTDRIFIDANVWLSVRGPVAYRYDKVEVYSKALRDIQLAGCKIFIDALVLSEFINSFARLVYKQTSSKLLDFKAFRKSVDFNPVADEIAFQAKVIVDKCECCDSNFANVNLDDLLLEYGKGNSDFNDQIIREICLNKELTMLTDDSDFGAFELDILTANKNLL